MTTSRFRHLRVAARTLVRQPAFLATAVLSLAAAIAVNTTTYSMLDAMVNPRIAGAHPERLYTIRYYGDRRGVLGPAGVTSALRTGLRSYEAVTGYRLSKMRVGVARGTRIRETEPMLVRSDFFSVVGISAVDGRFARAGDGDATPSIVISDRLRGELFPDGASPIGSTVTLDGRAGTVVAVARRYPGFDALDADVWQLESGAGEALVPINLIRLRPGFDLADVHRELAMLASRLAAAAGESARDTRFYYKPITRQFHFARFHFALVGAVIAVLLVACANLSNLQLARGLDRGRELAVRASLGATRRDLVVLLLSESAILAAAGLVLGLILTYWAMSLVAATVPESAAGFFVAPQASWRLLVVAAGASLVCMLLVGLFPALRVSRVDLNTLMKSGTGTGAHRKHREKYGMLLVAQIGLTLPLLSGAVLLARSAWRLERPEYRVSRLVGLEPDSVVVAHVRYPAPSGTYVRLAPLASRLVESARGIDHVSHAAVIIPVPTVGSAVTVADAAGGVTEFAAPMWNFHLVSPEYFRTMGMPIEQGADFRDGIHDQASAIIDRSTYTFLWAHGPTTGRLIKFGNVSATESWVPVIGVRGDHLDDDGRKLRAWFDTLRLSNVYRVITPTDSVRAGRGGVGVTLYARASTNPPAVVIALRRSLQAMEVDVHPQVVWMRDELWISDTITRTRFVASIFMTSAVLCLALAVLGVYGIVSQSVAQRRREIAVRIFLGATPAGILKLILREGNVFALAGIAVGLFLTVRTVGWLGTFMGNEDISGVMFFGGLSIALFGIATLAALVPAARATMVDPAEALRAE